MFKEVLSKVLNRTEGCLGVLIMGTDGIPVERIWHSEAEEMNLDVAVAEYTSLVRNAQRTNREMGLKKLDEVVLSGESGTFILRFISEDYFVVMILSQEGNFGRGRYELRRAELLLEKEFVI